MFKKAVDFHEASRPKPKSLSHQLFPSSPLDGPPPPSRLAPQPLSDTSGNALRKKSLNSQSGGYVPFKQPSANTAIKRTSSGLEKALSTASADVYFDENDFDSDLELDVEDPNTLSTVEDFKRPALPQQSTSKHNAAPDQPTQTRRPTQSVLNRASTVDSGYGTQQSESANALAKPLPGSREQRRQRSLYSKGIQTSSHVDCRIHNGWMDRDEEIDSHAKLECRGTGDETTIKAEIQSSNPALPRSPSPPEHLQTPSGAMSVKIEQSAQVQETRENEVSEPRPPKRRTLPWLQKDAEARTAKEREEEQRKALERVGRLYYNREQENKSTYTPLPKNRGKESLPWNTTASAVKQQQKSLREANKKLVKTNEATDEDKQAAIFKQKKNKISKVFLSEEQQHVLQLVTEQKKSVFFTGSAGTGKSVLLREIIAGLRRKFAREPDRVAVTASTGLAACNVGGVTLHSFAGIGLGKESVEELVKKIKRNQKAAHRWKRTKILVVDEVSMVDGDMFDKLEAIARMLRNNGRPFGGIQLVITGDFFQLPPVPEGGRAAKFAFDAGTWNTCIEYTIALRHVFRQKDPVFANMLNEMREGHLSPASISSFQSLNRPLPESEEGIQATELFPTRNEVDRANFVRMHDLPGETRVFEAKDGGTITDKVMRDKLLSNCMAAENISLKKGSQVMLIKNIDDTLVNGSLGKVVGFMSETQFDSYNNEPDEYNRLQDAENDELNPMERRQKKKLDLAASTAQQYPLVRFVINDGTTRDLLCQRESWKIELPNGEVQASRSQVPLILAWALSIHKAQGQTLERVKVDLGKVFEKGQAYVALSRATSMHGLQVLRFDPRKVMAHDRVRHFYKGLSRAGENTGTAAAQTDGGALGRMMKNRN